MHSRSFRSGFGPKSHRCCGARVSIGAYGEWHLCEACETLLSERHVRRRARAGGGPAAGSDIDPDGPCPSDSGGGRDRVNSPEPPPRVKRSRRRRS